MSKTEAISISVVIFYFAVIIAAIGGWIANVAKLFGAAADPITAMFIIRCLGVPVAPLGAILGYL